MTGSFLHAGRDSIPFLAQWSDSVDFTPVLAVDPPARVALPARIELAVAGANPFVHEATVRYSLPSAGLVDVSVFDVSGARVATIERGFEAAGSHRASWNGVDERGIAVPVGVYFVRLRTGAATRSVPVILLR